MDPPLLLGLQVEVIILCKDFELIKRVLKNTSRVSTILLMTINLFFQTCKKACCETRDETDFAVSASVTLRLSKISNE